MRLAFLVLAAGCTQALSIGAQGLTTTDSGRSAEVVAGGGAGISGVNAHVEGSLGVATSGGVEGHVLGGAEAVSPLDCGRPVGGQFRAMIGGSFGAYQSPDVLFEGAVGLHWNVRCDRQSDAIRLQSIALDLVFGYALRVSDGRGDGPLFGLALTYRFDKIGLIHIGG